MNTPPFDRECLQELVRVGYYGMERSLGLPPRPDGTPIMLVDPKNRLDKLGINQFFFESREPPADEYGHSTSWRSSPSSTAVTRPSPSGFSRRGEFSQKFAFRSSHPAYKDTPFGIHTWVLPDTTI
jgi:hypothetical protein